MVSILLIDDNDGDREIFGRVLRELDQSFTLLTADSGVAALQKIKANERFIPDYIFLDLDMPVMAGAECLAEIKKIQRLASTPVVVYSGTSSAASQARVYELGAAYYLLKPVNTDRLKTKLAYIFENKDILFYSDPIES